MRRCLTLSVAFVLSACLPSADPDVNAGAAPPPAAVPFWVWHDTSDATPGPAIAAAMAHQSASGVVFGLDWAAIQPTCGASNFAPNAQAALPVLAAAIRPGQALTIGIGGGARAPACLAVKYVTLENGFMSKDGDAPCAPVTLPNMVDPKYAAAYVAETHALLEALRGTPAASGGMMIDHLQYIVLGAYATGDSEFSIEGKGCQAGNVNQTPAQQAAIWRGVGYTDALALSTMKTIVSGIFADPDMPKTAGILQNLNGGDKQSVPTTPSPVPVVQPLLAWALAAYGPRYVISWNEVSVLSVVPPDLLSAATAGTPMILQFNGTADGEASCDGIEGNGSEDKVPASAGCFAAMQARFLAAVPPASKLVAWQALPGDWSAGLISP